MTLDEILKQSPKFQGEQTAVYSMHCCWWTSFPDDLGNTSDFKWARALRDDLKAEYKKHLPTDTGLPCCPHCGSVLMQAPLGDFIQAAQFNPHHYGSAGIDTFVLAHSRNSPGCRRTWAEYPLQPKRFA